MESYPNQKIVESLGMKLASAEIRHSALEAEVISLKESLENQAQEIQQLKEQLDEFIDGEEEENAL